MGYGSWVMVAGGALRREYNPSLVYALRSHMCQGGRNMETTYVVGQHGTPLPTVHLIFREFPGRHYDHTRIWTQCAVRGSLLSGLVTHRSLGGVRTQSGMERHGEWKRISIQFSLWFEMLGR